MMNIRQRRTPMIVTCYAIVITALSIAAIETRRRYASAPAAPAKRSAPAKRTMILRTAAY